MPDNQNNIDRDLTTEAGQVFTETYSVPEDIQTQPTVHISQEAFTLCEADFLRIKGGRTKTSMLASGLLLTSLGMAFIPLTKYIQIKFLSGKITIETWEWMVPVVGVSISFILYLIGKILPNEKKQVMKDIESHFTSAPRTRHVGERGR